MSAPVKLNFKLYQGSTFREVFRWESSTKVYKPIQAITKSAPAVITAADHELPVGWRTRVVGCGGMKEINSGDNYYTVFQASEDTITLNEVNSLKFTDYTSGGVLEYNQPVDLEGYTARMQLRPKINSDIILDTLTTENGKLIIDNVDKTITIEIPASVTEDYNFSIAFYSLELVAGTEVVPFINGTITLIKETTR